MAVPLVHASVTLAADVRRLAVVADTHSAPHADTARWLRAYAPDAILHAGDIGELGVLADLRAIAPVHAVRGNIDTRANQLPDVLTLEMSGLRILMMHIAVAGPRIRADAAKLARAAAAKLIVCGHSHVPFLAEERGLTVFNPGSVGPRRFALPIVFGTLELADGRVRLAHVSCETGERWLPPAY